MQSFKGQYQNSWYHRNDDPATIALLTIDNEAIIKNIVIQETHYEIVSHKITDSYTTNYEIEQQIFEEASQTLTLFAKSDRLLRFEIHLLDNSFQKLD
jgi:hypothetical protein